MIKILPSVKFILIISSLISPHLVIAQSSGALNNTQKVDSVALDKCLAGNESGSDPKVVTSTCLGVLKQSLSSDQRAAVLNMLGLVSAGSEDYDSAIRYYDLALQTIPNYQWSLQNKGSVLITLGQCDNAHSLYDSSLKNNPQSSVALFGIGESLKCKRKYKEALKYYDDALVEAPHIDGYYRTRAQIQMALGAGKRAIEDIDAAIRLNPLEKSYIYQAALIAYGAGNLEVAKKRVVEAIANNPADGYSVLLKHLIALQGGGPGDLPALNQLMTRFGNTTNGWLASLTTFLLGRLSETELAARAKDPKKSVEQSQLLDYHYYVGEILLAKGARSEALIHFKLVTETTGTMGYGEFWNAAERVRKLAGP